MRLLYATRNSSKIYNMKRRLKHLPIDLVTPKDVNVYLDIEENGKRPVENALKKATSYYEKTHIPTIGADTGVYISSLPNEKQPGTYVRRVNGKELSDKEMIEYYSNLLSEYGGSSDAYNLTGLALVTEEGVVTTEIEEDHYILTDKVNIEHNHRGNPLDVLAIDPTCGKYYCEMTDDDFNSMNYKFEQECLDFIEDNLIKSKSKKIK